MWLRLYLLPMQQCTTPALFLLCCGLLLIAAVALFKPGQNQTVAPGRICTAVVEDGVAEVIDQHCTHKPGVF
jgi:hypothetical protein